MRLFNASPDHHTYNAMHHTRIAITRVIPQMRHMEHAMNADPQACPHLHLTYDHNTRVVYCPDCMWWWDADFETPTHVSFDHGDENDTYENHPEWWEDDTRVCLNPDNEPTSEYMQWMRNSKNSDEK